MYEQYTYEFLMKRALARVPSNVDKRQGSIIWDALAPACAELAQMYIQLEYFLAMTFAETASGDWLTKRCAEMGVNREAATKAIRLGLFYTGNDRAPFDVSIGSRYNIETLNYTVTEQIETGKFRLECEEAGIVGNQLFGRLIPIETINGLSYAELTDVLTPGEDEETDAVLYVRYVEAVNSTPYGGNIDDYKQAAKAQNGVGGCKVFPVWNGGGTVKVTLITTEYSVPSEDLIANVQEYFCPTPYLGTGKAPIGHDVTVCGVSGVEISFGCTLSLKSGVTLGAVQEAVVEAVSNYLLELSMTWENEDYLIVRINQIEARILSISGIVDISDTTLNGGSSNIALGEEEIPIIGEVAING